MIDIVVPTWNRNDVLPRCLNSIVGAESITVVDDGSDIPATVPAGVQLVHIAHTGLPGKVKNTGVRIGEAQYVAVVDSDDYLTPNAIAKVEAFITASGFPSVIMTDQKWLEKDGSFTPVGPQPYDPFRMHQLVVVKRTLWEQVGGWPEDIPAAVDSAYYVKLWNAVGAPKFLDEKLYVKDVSRKDAISVRLKDAQAKHWEEHVKLFTKK